MAARVDAHERRLLGLLGAAAFFNRYDQALLSLLLVQIQQDLAIPEAQLGALGSMVRLGALPAAGVLLLADRWGRRRLLLVTISGYALCTAATAFAPDFRWLVAFQVGARLFVAAEFLLGFVVVVEEFRPGNRGLGVGLLGTLGALGHGAALLLFGAVDGLPFGWRGLYALGVLPLLVVGLLRRGLPETERFRASRAARAAERGLGAWLRPLAVLVRDYPARFAAVMAVAFLWSFSNTPVDFFLPKYFQEVHGWSPARFALVAVAGGALGLTGQPLAGWLGDRHGRRRATLATSVAEPLAAVALYLVLGPLAVGLYVGWVFASVANDVLGRTFEQELFPTSARATAAGVGLVVSTLGAVASLACESALFGAFGEHWLPVRLLALSGLGFPILVFAFYPETSRRPLEEVAPEAAPTRALPEAKGAV